VSKSPVTLASIVKKVDAKKVSEKTWSIKGAYSLVSEGIIKPQASNQAYLEASNEAPQEYHQASNQASKAPQASNQAYLEASNEAPQEYHQASNQAYLEASNENQVSTSEALTRLANGAIGKREFTLLKFLFLNCKRNMSLQTSEIKTEDLVLNLKMELQAVRNLISRSTKNGFLTVQTKQYQHNSVRVFIFSKDVFKYLENLFQASNEEYRQESSEASKYVSKKVLNTYILGEPLKRIGLTENHLTKSKRTPEDIQEILFHFAFSIENNELKSSQKLPVLLSILNDETKSWVSEGYLKSLQLDLDQNEKRLKDLLDTAERRKALGTLEKFKAYLAENPNFLESIKNSQKFQVSDQIIESIAFEKFKSIET
jgi:hypothetical protein